MSTNAFIGVQCEDGIRAVYLHFDGNAAGRTLNQHYTNFMKVCTLINGGDLSSLGPEIGEKHNFDDYTPEVCTYYARDRGGNPVFDKYETEAEFVEYVKGRGTPYAYLFSDGGWVTYKFGG